MITLRKQHRRYEKYRDSGVEWLGKIPEEWELERLKFSVEVNPSKTETKALPDEAETSFVPMEAVSEWGDCDLSTIKTMALVREGFTYFTDNSVLIAKITPCFENGKGAVISGLHNGVGFGSTEFIVLRPKEDTNPKFIYYLTRSHNFRMTGENEMRGSAGQKRVPEDFVRNYRMPRLPRHTQSSIASYLDEKCALIDSIIIKKQRQIELLKEQRAAIINRAVTRGLDESMEMKESGVEWIGEIPKGWEVRKLKRLCRIFGRIGFRGYTVEDIVDAEEGALSLSPSNIIDHQIQFNDCTYISIEKYEESPEIKVIAGDILFVKTGSTIGKCAVFQNYSKRATLNPQLVVLKNLSVSNYYLYYLMTSNIFSFQVYSSVVGGSTPSLNQSKLGAFIVLMPTSKEQDKIVHHIMVKTGKIENMITKVEESISFLSEYKTSLISHAVTGRIKID